MKANWIVRGYSFRRCATVAVMLVSIGGMFALRAAQAGDSSPIGSVPAVAASADGVRGAAANAEPSARLVDAVFERRAGVPAIYLMDSGGANAELLVRVPDARWNEAPAWSNDGAWIAFDATKGDFTAGRIYLVALTGSLKSTLLDLGPGLCPHWSPDDQRITFFLWPDNPDKLRSGVWVMRADGTGRQWIAEGDRPRWSPDGTKIAYVNRDPKSPGIDVIDVVTREVRRIVDMTYNDIPGPTWSPDGKSLAFCGTYSSIPQRGELVIVDVEMPQIRRTVFKGNVGWVPSWSPDGRQILFWAVDGQAGISKFHVIVVVGDPMAVLLPGQTAVRQNSDGAWSPDGKKIAFSNDR